MAEPEAPPPAEGAPAEGEPEVSPDKLLQQLYQSARPAVELLPGVSLSALINACWLEKDAKALLTESWIPVPPEEAEGGEAKPPPAFDPAAIEYRDLYKRLSKSAQLTKWNELTIAIKVLELETERTRDPAEKEAKTAELEGLRGQFADVEGQLAELKASFQEDPLSLVPWMANLFALADAGLTTFEVSGPFFPYANLRQLFTGDNSASYYEGVEKVLGVFKRRYEKERGPGKIQVLTRLVPNIYQDGYDANTMVEALVDKIRTNIYGEVESPEQATLDFLQLSWWDCNEKDVLPTLKALQRLTEDKLEFDPETGEPTAIAEPKKVRGIGLVDFPPRALVSAIQAGVPVVAVSIPFSLADRSYGKTLQLARQYNLKVFARSGLLCGLVSEKYLGAPCPDTAVPDPDLDEVGAALEIVNNYGGWPRIQRLLQEVKKVADKHGVRMQTVALRWLIDNGTFPLATTRWGDRAWSQFGYLFHTKATPGVDYQTFQVESFLDQDDMRVLNALGTMA